MLRDRGRRPEQAGHALAALGAGPAAFGAPLTMLEPPWRVAAAEAAARAQKVRRRRRRRQREGVVALRLGRRHGLQCDVRQHDVVIGLIDAVG